MLPAETYLPPGPWTARGTSVTDGYGNVIAIAMYPHHAALIAQWIAHVPALAQRADPAVVESLNTQIKELEEEIESHDELAVSLLEEELADAQSDLADATKEVMRLSAILAINGIDYDEADETAEK
jgi:hypothetical protein